MQSSRSVTLVSCLFLFLPAFAIAADPPAAGRLHLLLNAEDVIEQPTPSPQSHRRGATDAVVHSLDKKIPATATVTVDCTKGQSINDALTTPAITLTVEIHGICTENVVVTRPNTTLVGTSPAADGIRGDVGFPKRVVWIHGVGVAIQNLSIANGPRYGLYVDASGSAAVSNCDVFGNGVDGISSVSGFVTVASTTVHNSGRADLGAWAGGDIGCDHCTLSGSPIGTLGISGSRLMLTNSSIQASVIAFGAAEHGFISFDTGSFASSIDVEDQSQLSISAGTQTADPSGFYADETSSVVVDNHTLLFGSVSLVRFSNLSLRNGSKITGDLACYSGANAWCEDPAAVGGSTTGCSACVKP